MDLQIDQATARKLAAAERERKAAIPPATLSEVVEAGSIASFLNPSEWGAVQELARELDGVKADEKAILEKIEEVKHAAWMKGMRRVQDVSAMAAAAMRGEIPTETPPVTPTGLAALSGQGLQDLKSGLDQKHRETVDRASWLQGRLRAATKDLCKVALERVATQYGELLIQAKRLRPLLDAGQQIVGEGIIAGQWRDEKWLAPKIGTMARVESDVYYGLSYIATFASGAGIPGALEGWAAAVKAATGQDVK